VPRIPLPTASPPAPGGHTPVVPAERSTTGR